MGSTRPPDFAAVANEDTKQAFLHGRPDTVEWLGPGTKLFKWTKSITTPQGVSPWWQFLESRTLANGTKCPGIRELQEYAARLSVRPGLCARPRGGNGTVEQDDQRRGD